MTCKLTNARKKVTCKVTYVSAARARLVRAGKTVARSRIAKGKVTFVARTRLAKGTYTVVVAGKRKLRLTLR